MADITGTNSNDTLQGGEGSDTIIGADGDDSITGSGGNDTIQGDSSTVTPPTTASDQQTMNESDSNTHESGPVVEALSDGNFFLAWYEGADGSSTGGPVKGKIVDSEGNDLSGVFDISDPSLFGVRTEDLNDMPPLDATLLDDGSVVVTYQSGFSGNGSGSHDDEGTALKGIVVDPSDPVAPSAGTEFLVNAADSNAFESGGVVEALPDGGFFVAWYENAETNATDNSGTQILGQYFDADGNKVGAQVQVGDHTSSVGVQISEYVDMPPLDVTVLENGDVAVTYNAGFNNSHSYTGDDHGSAVVGSIIDSSTQTAGAEFLINDGNTNTDEGPAIIEALPDGGFVAMWYEQSVSGTNNGYPHARIFDDDGNPVTGPLNLGTHNGDGYVSGNDQHESGGHNMPVMDMVVMADGNIAVTWLAGEGSGGQSVDVGGTTVMGAIIDASTGTVGDEFIINDPNSGASEEPARIEALPDGGFVAVWAEGGGGDQHDGYLQVQYFDAAGNKLGDAIEIGTPGSAQDARVASDGEYDQPPVDFAVQDDGSIFIGFQGADHITNADYDDRGSALIGATIAPPTIVEDGAGNDTIAGGDGDDLIFGGAGSDSISGGSGDDYIDGGDGDDYLTTGLGQDTLIGGEGDDTLKNSAGDDSLVGGAGNDSIVATAGNDTLEGGDGADTLDGGSENDSVSGGAGDDVIYTGLGDDEASGGDDADVFHVHGAEGIEFNQTGTDGLALVSDMSDFPTDELSFEMQFSSTGAASSSQVFASYAVPGEDNEFQVYELTTSELYVTIAGQGVNTGVSTSGLYDGSPHSLAVTWESSTGDLKLYLDGAEVYSGTVATGDTLTQGGAFTFGQEQDVVGGGFELDDRFQGEIHNAKLFNDVRTPSEIASDAGDHEADTSDANLIAGWVPDAETGGFSDLTGNHDMTMSGDAEIVTTLGGDDTITGGEGGTDIDTIDLSALTVPVTVTYTGDEAGTITDGTNTITFSEIEKLILTDQADVVDASDDSVGVDIDGAGGNDLITGGLGKDTLDGGDGDDTLIAGFDDGTGDVFIGGSGTDTYQIDGSPVENWAFNVDLGSGSDQYGNTYSGIENIIGGDRDDTLTGDGEDNVFDGRAGADSLSGGDGSDTLIGGAGSDTLSGDAGNDSLDGGEGENLLQGGVGDDTISVHGSSDSIHGGDGYDIIDRAGATDAFHVDTFSGIEEIRAGEGGEGWYWNSSAMRFEGGSGPDTVSAGSDADTINAGDGDDLINAGDGADVVDGGAGADTLDGGTGDDSLTGGAGNDTFTYAPGDGHDTITDFNAGNTGALDDGDSTNNDYVDLSDYYDNLSELYADQADDGVLNQSNTTDSKGRSTDYSDNTQFGANDSMTFQGASADNSSFTEENTGVVCFTSGTAIRTPTGDVLIDDLRVDDLVCTMDNGPQPIRWIGRRALRQNELAANPKLRPVLIPKGIIGAERNLLVSRQHALLINRDQLARAVHLTGTKGLPVRIANGRKNVTYIHLMFDAHEIIFAENVPAESFYPGPMAMEMLEAEARDEMMLMFPEFADVDLRDHQKITQIYGDAARSIAKRKALSMTNIFDPIHASREQSLNHNAYCH